MRNSTFQQNLHAVETVFVTLYVANGKAATRSGDEDPDVAMATRASIADSLYPKMLPFLQSLFQSQRPYLQQTSFDFIASFADWFGKNPQHNKVGGRA